MRCLLNLRTVIAGVVVVAIVIPILAQAWPVCGDGDMKSDMRCAGLWAAGCCAYSAAKPRVQGSDHESNARPVQAPPVSSNPYQYLVESQGLGRVAIGQTPTASSEPGLSSTVLRL